MQIKKDDIFYEANGDINNSRPTILFIHGAGQSRLTWKFQLEAFSNLKEINFVIPDLPGHGNSKGSGLRTVAEYAEFIKDFVNTLGLRNITMIGHSMGGGIAQLIALDSPDYLKAIVLVCTGAWMRVAKESMNAVKSNYSIFCDVAPTRAFAEKSPEGLKTKFREGLLNTSQDVVYHDLKACDEFDISDSVINIKVPTLIIGAELDVMTPPKYSEYLHHQIHDSEMIIVGESGHFVMQEKHEEFNRIILDYINKS